MIEIAGVLVHSCRGKLDRVARLLAAVPGVEVHARDESGRLVITVEADGDTAIGDSLLAINRLEGVLTASLVYHHYEEGPAEIGNQEKGNETVPA